MSKISTLLRGFIFIWSGTIDSIPNGFSLCDGNNGTINLTDKFIVGAGVSYPALEEGGSLTHWHSAMSGDYNQLSNTSNWRTGSGSKAAAVQNTTVIPPYYALAFIQWVGFELTE